MTLPTEQENKTRRRTEILDADYVPRDDAPNTPRVIGEPRSRRGVSPVTAITVCIALLALALAVSRGEGDREEPERAEPAYAGWEIRGERASAGPAEGADPPEKLLLGAAVETLSGPVAAYYSLKDCPQVPGVQVCALERDSAAAAAGLEPGDVITAADGEEILTAEELAGTLRRCTDGEVTLTVYRLGETLELTARLPAEENTDD